ncbi:hypothetical protein RE628_18230 [Paenibacillus sp. D2_2]|uniref:hypothetical protein n=1 Tax=Paenibacillus sp. D2_2 TaxID=3073092 RepID=UPI0028153CC0|nr:hypothetical protein [Paenibacillus sp. D2_2]WMT39378.1 hypothetical protein RE628_18230 [Paenibacillus sp. D2_2]
MESSLRERLETILLTKENIALAEEELLSIIPELIVCKDCEQHMPGASSARTSSYLRGCGWSEEGSRSEASGIVP